MATTSPDNLRTPDMGDQYALVQDLGVLASTTQDAFDRRANTFVGTTAQRNAYTDTAKNGQLWQETDGVKQLYRKDGSAWVRVVPNPPAIPKIRTGAYTFNGVTPDVAMLQNITFPAGYFTSAPMVFLTGQSGVTTGTVLHMWVYGDPTVNGFTIAMAKGSNFAQRVNWMAIQTV